MGWGFEDIIDKICYGHDRIGRNIDKLFEGENFHLDSDFGDPRDILSRKHKGYNIGGRPENNLSLKTSYENLMVCAGIGSGKTSCFLIPGLMRMHGSFLIYDSAPEIYDLTAAYLKQERGYDIKVIDLIEAKGESYCPINGINTDTDAGKAAKLLVEGALGKNPKDPFWNNKAESALTAGIQTVKNMPEEFQHMTQVYEFFRMMQSRPKEADQIIARFAPPSARDEYMSLITSSNTNASILTSIMAALKPWSDEMIRKTTSSHSIDFTAMRKTPIAVYIKTTVTSATYFSPLVSLIADQFFDSIFSNPVNEDDLPLHFVCDEFPNLLLPNISQILNNIRKMRASCALYIQSLQQLEDKYGTGGAKSILSGIRNKAFFGGGIDNSTAKELETYLGQYQYENEGKTYTRHLMTSAEIQRMSPEQCLFFSQHNLPYAIDTLSYYKQRTLKTWAELPPHQGNTRPLPEPQLFNPKTMDDGNEE